MDSQKIKKLALESGFKLKEQLDGSLDLNPYVYEFAKSLVADVIADRDELSAQVSAFKNIREDWQGLAINDAKTLIAFIKASDKTPAQHLAEIRAEAGRAGFIEGATKQKEIGWCSVYGMQDGANQYAASIRKGGAK